MKAYFKKKPQGFLWKEFQIPELGQRKSGDSVMLDATFKLAFFSGSFWNLLHLQFPRVFNVFLLNISS